MKTSTGDCEAAVASLAMIPEATRAARGRFEWLAHCHRRRPSRGGLITANPFNRHLGGADSKNEYDFEYGTAGGLNGS